MNWIDHEVHPMKIPEGWVDLWAKKYEKDLRRNPGYTYDQKKNKMLLGSRYRSRLDRVLVYHGGHGCSKKRRIQMDDWEISMVGTEKIKDVTYLHRSNRTGRETVLPVYPSDHFGLLVKVKIKTNADRSSFK